MAFPTDTFTMNPINENSNFNITDLNERFDSIKNRLNNTRIKNNYYTLYFNPNTKELSWTSPLNSLIIGYAIEYKYDILDIEFVGIEDIYEKNGRKQKITIKADSITGSNPLIYLRICLLEI